MWLLLEPTFRRNVSPRSLRLVFLCSVIQLLVTANVHRSPILFTLMMEAIWSFETLILTRVTHYHIPEDGSLHNYRHENLKYYKIVKSFLKIYFCKWIWHQMYYYVKIIVHFHNTFAMWSTFFLFFALSHQTLYALLAWPPVYTVSIPSSFLFSS
jgi:hypothetical protein